MKQEITQEQRENKREYYQRPEVKKHRNEWHLARSKTPKGKAYIKEYLSRPEVKKRRAEQQAERRKKEWVREYHHKYGKRPEVMEYKREYNKKNKEKINARMKENYLKKIKKEEKNNE